MPKRTDIESIMIIGAGPITIGQACEFDYSGTQACKALKQEGYRIIVVNSNPATIMTDPGQADATYVEPMTLPMIERVIEREQPHAILPTIGGQTGLNLSLALAKAGVLERYNVDLIGANAQAIETAEDRHLFRIAMDKIGLESPRAVIAESIEQAHAALDTVGLPAIIRPAFTLGGTGGGIAYTHKEFIDRCRYGLAVSPVQQILIDESLLGWKEYEMEVIRDKADNAIIVCSIENVDPMGVHTGDSITVAPALTLTDKEYQKMRSDSIAVLRTIGVATGGSNVQWAVNPETGRMVVIEMNPRVSRSSALASKATGFPIAKVAAKLAVGYTLDELDNDINPAFPAAFEPTIDYVVTKIPRFVFEKFPDSDQTLSTAMKSVGEVMAIGQTFAESLQKALVAMESGLAGLDTPETAVHMDKNALLTALRTPTKDRLLLIAEAMRRGIDVETLNGVTGFDLWFLRQIATLIDAEAAITQNGLPQSAEAWRDLKQMGFSDARIALLTKTDEPYVRAQRHAGGVYPVYRRIDTCAAEFDAPTAYMYSAYVSPYQRADGTWHSDCEAKPNNTDHKVIILGSGPNRIGQGIEFDYCCCHACFALSDLGYQSIMINCNPETVSTDYDTSNRLYFEPLTLEHVLEIIRIEQSVGSLRGVIIQFGGQTPLKLAKALAAAGVPILGTAPQAIDAAEDRERFQNLVQDLNLLQPDNAIAYSTKSARALATQLGYPLVLRPSYVLGGRAMEIIHNDTALDKYIRDAVVVSGNTPVLLDRYLEGAIEVDVDALSDGTHTHIAGIMQHIEQAGVHSGDSACALPALTLSPKVIQTIETQTRALAQALSVVGLMNVQFAIQDQRVYVIEVNPRASRTVPFVAKATGNPLVAMATRLMMGEKLSDFTFKPMPLGISAVKEVVIPFARFVGTDPMLGPEMRSTGEVMGVDSTFQRAFYKAQIAAGVDLPQTGQVFVSVRNADKANDVLTAVKTLLDMGFVILATRGTGAWLRSHAAECTIVNKVYEGSPHIVEQLEAKNVALVINTTAGEKSIADSRTIRQATLSQNIPYFTTAAAALAAAQAMQAVQQSTGLDVQSLQDLHKGA